MCVKLGICELLMSRGSESEWKVKDIDLMSSRESAQVFKHDAANEDVKTIS